MKLNRLVALSGALLLLAAVPASATLGVHGIGTNPCKVCHDTASGSPTLRGWSGGVPTGAAGPWSTRTLSALCYMCHETTQLNGAHDMSGNAYSAAGHKNTWASANLPRDPDGSVQTISTLLPYNSKTNMECTTCHNVHKSEDRPFLQRSAAQGGVGALCNECHAGRQNATPNRKTANTQLLGGRAYSTHPTNVAAADTSQANLKAIAAIQTTNVAVPFVASYALGGHLVSGATGNLDCGTCHAVHSTGNGTPATVLDLLAIENATSASGSALCTACHEGGANSANAVGVVNASDHPIDDAVGNVFRPSTVALSSLWTLAGGQVDRAAGAFFTTGVVGTPACSSCHDTHGGIGATAILHHPQATGDNTFAYGVWCWTCHAADGINPNNHHSNTGNLTTTLGDINSQLICNDCHGSSAGAEWTAHNGFWSFPVAISATNSLFCEDCHTATNPRFLKTSSKGKSFTNSATAFPATHGVLRAGASTAAAGSSHQVNAAANSTNNQNLVKKVSAWTASGGISQWGLLVNEPICESCHNILTNGASATQGLTQGWKANLLLQPYEDDDAGSVVNSTGEDGPMASSHDYYSASTYGAGGTGDLLCRGCHTNGVTSGVLTGFVHNPAAHTAVSSSYIYAGSEVPYGRSTTTILAPDGGGGSCPDRTTADAAGAPTITSYPAVNSLDCDSCHRPHNADNESLGTGGRYLILEAVVTAGSQGSTICVDCHDTDFQCN